MSTTNITQLYIHTAIINQVNNHMIASVPKAQAKITHRAWCTRWALALLSGPWFNEWPDELDQNIFNSISAAASQCEPRSMHNDCTRWYTEWIQQVHQNELNPPIQLSLYVNRLNVTYKTIITSHFCNRTSDMRVTSTWSWSTTRRIEEMNKVSLYKTNTSIMLCECTQYGHECDNPSEIPL